MTAFKIRSEIESKPLANQLINDVKLNTEKAMKVSDGIYVIPGNWFTGWVEQEDGIIVLEAPISSGYSAQLEAEVHKRYPAKKIKGVIVTSDAWPHLAGIREYIAAQTPVYTHFLNEAIINRVIASDYSLQPDRYQKHKVNAHYKFIKDSTIISDKTTPAVLYAVNGEGGERMTAVYFPKQKVLYASDLVQQMRDGSFFFIEYLAEIKKIVQDHHLAVDTVYAMHTKPLAWKVIEKVLEDNK